jgi:hypothetical protein
MTTKIQKAGRFFNLNGHVVPVKTLDEARAMWLDLRDSDGLGASDCVRGCGDYYEEGRKVAHVSYNGRMWTPRAWRARCPAPASPEVKP